MTFFLGDGKLLYFTRNIFFLDETHTNILTENHCHYNSIYTVFALPKQRRIVLNNFCVNFLSPSRRHAQELFKFLMTEYADCESVFTQEIEDNLWRRIGRKIVSIRAEINKMSHHSSRK